MHPRKQLEELCALGFFEPVPFVIVIVVVFASQCALKRTSIRRLSAFVVQATADDSVRWLDARRQSVDIALNDGRYPAGHCSCDCLFVAYKIDHDVQNGDDVDAIGCER